MHPEAVRLANAFANHFWSADHDITWVALEEEHQLQLDEHTVLVGKMDARGFTSDGEAFFGDWKTASKKKARYMDAEKAKWRMSPQALTYGVLLGDWSKRFTVRWALKTEPATCQFEWYTYTTAELDLWRSELLETAAEIRRLRSLRVGFNWPLNLLNCTRYGESYACPFRDGCYSLNFGLVPESMQPRDKSHLDIENRLRDNSKDEQLVVLDATRMNEWLECHEKYRRLWEHKQGTELGGLHEESEALIIGTDFHQLIAQHLNGIKEKQNVCSSGIKSES